jgi:acyl transferase domain-containing protein/NADPH:quinone reductase-like Zn-dependent oxidoreductase
MHGTGTQAGDPEEVKGVASVFSSSRPKSAPLIMGSIKSNIGHSEPAAGISGLIKAILAVENGKIPGNPTFIDPNPSIDFEGSRVCATRWTIPWPVQTGLRRASVNSFGYGGSNAHVIVDQVPEEKQNFESTYRNALDLDDDFFADTAEVSRPHILVVSANDDQTVKACTDSLVKHLLNPSVSVRMDSLAYTLSEKRSRHFHRGYVVTKSLALSRDSFVYGKRKSEAPKIGYVFTGQGAQWSQMGHALLKNFSVARDTIRRLDGVLQNLINPPTWLLMDELTERRSPEKLRQPEFSQPLVTALQIALVEVLRTFAVHPVAVVGHSSGEIAAAYTAGLLSEENAIKAAYYRGYAAKVTSSAQSSKMSMMAVGLGADEVKPYIAKAIAAHPEVKSVSIACHNSSTSVTLSGPATSLEAVRTEVVADGHFARMLQVDMAYHSPFMAPSGDVYVERLAAEGFSALCRHSSHVKMYSSVDGDWTQRPVDIEYWKSNMVQPVLFEQALRQMLSRQESPDFLVEIGPSGALAGPVGQVKKQLPGGGSNIQYVSALTRGQDAENAIFNAAGQLFISGYNIDLKEVNAIPTQPLPKTLIDLPNYSWNHNTDYWYESEASKDWRYRQFPHHDLLGSKVLGTAWQAPSWKKSLRLEDLPWLKDHRLGPEIVFPGAGYMCMAVEAMMQTDAVLRAQTGDTLKYKQQVRLRNVTFDRALVLEEGKETMIMLTLARFTNSKDAWHSWVVRSFVEKSWVDHCRGQVRMEKDVGGVGSPSDLAPLKNPAPGATWYKSMSDVGYNFGKAFQKLQLAETVSGSRECRARISLDAPPSVYAQSEYPIHPAAFDGCMQSCAPGLWNGSRSSVNAVLVPAVIDDIVIRIGAQSSGNGLSVSKSWFVGPGRKELTKNYASNAKVYDVENGELVFRLTGLRYHMLDFQDTVYAAHRYSRLVWGPDLTLSPHACGVTTTTDGWGRVQDILDLVAHKKPNAKVIEVVLVPGESSSVWLEGLSTASSQRHAFGSHQLMIGDASALVASQAKYEAIPRTAFSFFDKNTILESEFSAQKGDLVILRIPSHMENEIDGVIARLDKALQDDGHLFLIEQRGIWDVEVTEPVETVHLSNGFIADLDSVFQNNGFEVVHGLDDAKTKSLSRGYLAVRSLQHTKPDNVQLDVIHLTTPGQLCCDITRELGGRGWDVQESVAIESLGAIREASTILVISELETPQLPTLTSEQWASVRELLQKRNKIVWVSKSSQWQVSNPDGAMIHGLCRSVRTEDPSMRLITLDIEDTTSGSAVASIDTVLRAFQGATADQTFDCEYVERDGVFHVSRIIGDDSINATEAAKTAGAPPVQVRLHEASTTIRMIAERVGSIDSLQFVEVSASELPLPDNTVEVELFASALNFKDVAVTMGIVPENHHLLGLEGAGTIRRVGANLNSPFHVGERVLVFEKGTFANRIIATTERTIHIPDWLSFEEAATLPSVYLTALYSLFNLSSIRKGDRVLIHSATGGLGIASIQICQSVGAEIFATVGQDIKKQFLIDNYNIPEDHIFSSRTQEFETSIMELTDGYGVDIILNSLTGDLLDASWRCIAEGGTMIELGKKDHIDRNTLAMEPFARNASYRCFDMSHKHVTDQVIGVYVLC